MTDAQTLVASFAAHAGSHPQRVALWVGDEQVSYQALYERVAGAAAGLREAGVGRGDRVAIVGPNSTGLVVAYLASHAVAAIAVPIGSDVPPGALAQILEDSAPRVVLVDGVALPPGVEGTALSEFAARTHDELIIDCAPEDAADMMFTSGTTGRKKGVLLGQDNVWAAANSINGFVRAQPDDVEVVPLPLNHSFGLGRVRCLALVGHTLVIEDGMRNPARVFKRLQEVQATGLALVPAGFALLRRMVRKRMGELADRLRYIEIGSAALQERDATWLMQQLPHTRICHHFGLTEASRAVFKELHESSERPGTVGRPSPGVTLRVLGEDGEPVAEGQSGEIWVRGGQVMREYYGQPERTAEALQDGWLRTGDLGRMDTDGYLYLVGRKGEMINVGGRKVAPGDVDAQLQQFPGLADGACVGVEDPRGITGQAVKAYVVCEGELDEEALSAFLHERLAEHEVPRLFERVQRIPRTPAGKVQRHLLAEETP